MNFHPNVSYFVGRLPISANLSDLRVDCGVWWDQFPDTASSESVPGAVPETLPLHLRKALWMSKWGDHSTIADYSGRIRRAGIVSGLRVIRPLAQLSQLKGREKNFRVENGSESDKTRSWSFVFNTG